MTRLTIILISILWPFVYTSGQRLPCSEVRGASGTCEDACISCNLEGLSGRHEGAAAGMAPKNFCTFVRHNIRWIGFLAASENLSIKLNVSNCILGSGLEAAIYKSEDCGEHTLISNCRGGNNPIRPGTSAIFSTTELLQVGQPYYIVMDGNFGDNCDWSVSVVEGKASLSPLQSSGIIQGNHLTCPGITNTYFTKADEGAVHFDWTLNGIPLQSSKDTIALPFLVEGLYQLCVTASNACDSAPTSCTTIHVVNPDTTKIEEIICVGDCITIDDEPYCDEGTYEIILQSSIGCDSIIHLTIENAPNPEVFFHLNICEGDTFFIDDEAYFDNGIFEKLLTTEYGCDSLITLDLFTVICNIESTSDHQPPLCNSEPSADMSFSITNGTPPFNYTIRLLDNTEIARGHITELDEITHLQNVIASDYITTVDDLFGNQEIIIEQIDQPERLRLTILTSDYSGFGIRCHSNDDGGLETLPFGGTQPYQFEWSNGAHDQNLTDLASGDYTLTLTDSHGCEEIEHVALSQPDTLLIEGSFNSPECEDMSSGSIHLISQKGGAGKVRYSLDNYDFVKTPVFSGLSPGTYLLVAIDQNDCMAFDRDEVIAPDRPEIDLLHNLSVGLGDSILIEADIRARRLSWIKWYSSMPLSCDTCFAFYAAPLFNTDFMLTAGTEDGCMDEAYSRVEVQKFREFYVPNIFSPNGDGINDLFMLHPGKEVAAINIFQVFDRWGGLLFETNEVVKDKTMKGWDGMKNGQQVLTDSYAWYAEIEFIDGETENYQGLIQLMR